MLVNVNNQQYSIKSIFTNKLTENFKYNES